MTPTPEELLGYDAISELTGVSVKTLRAWKARGKLPAPDYVVLTGNPVPAWKAITIAKWNARRIKSEALRARMKEADNGVVSPSVE